MADVRVGGLDALGSLFDFRVLASVALVDGLAAPIVAFETPYFIAGSVMLVSSFGLIALGMVWSK